MDVSASDTPRDEPAAAPPPSIPRTVVAGILMGLANLVPGVSGGTMILVSGLYDEFITAIADVTRFRLTRRNVAFLGLVGAGAVVAIGALAGTLSQTVTLHRSAMYALFIGLTLGGAPLLTRMIGRASAPAVVGAVMGLGLMMVIAMTSAERPDSNAVKEALARGEFVVEANYSRDLLAGALGMSAMVLPGISGAYMLLILHRYETILASISLAKRYALSGGEGDAGVFLAVIVPTGIGAIMSLVLLSNILKWLLHHHQQPTLGFLLGILFGSVVGIWPFDSDATTGDYALGLALAGAGFVGTSLLARIGK